MLQATLDVWRKELTDGARDRRSVTAALVYSLVGPLVMGLALGSLAAERAEDAPLTVAVGGSEHAPSLVRHLEQRQVAIAGLPADPQGAIAGGKLDLAMLVSPDYGGDFSAARPAVVRLVLDSSRAESRRAAERLDALLRSYSGQVAELRLAARGVSPRLVRPLEVQSIDVSTPASRAAVALAMLPIFLLVAAFVGGMNVAIDATAGERERRTLESLLLNPVPRAALAAGKWLAAATVGLVAVVLTLAVSWWVLRSDVLDELGIDLALVPGRGWSLLALLVPVVLLACAAQLLIGLYCRSYKEAQTYLSLLLFAPMLPGFFFAFGTVRESAWMEAVPLLGQQLLIAQALRGETVEGIGLLLLGTGTLLAALGCVVLAARLLDHERIVVGG